jgi:predicted phage-related endonuclease
MKNGLIRTDTKNMTHEQWQLFRMQNGIGASEAAIVLNLNPYQSAVKLFYNKVEMNIENIENEKMFWGTVLEESVANVWKYWKATLKKQYKTTTMILR